ncbi:MAG: hypothetical protein ACYTG0_24210, partial [Planctomycetota bacterium]
MGPERSEIRNGDSSPARRRRPWYRLHLSTWIVLLIAGTILFLSNVPGERRLSQTAATYFVMEHGWPLVYLVRLPEGPVWDPVPSMWPLTKGVVSFDPLTLAADVAVAALVLIFTAAVFETRRRRRKRLQFSLRTLLVAVLIVSAALAWLTTKRRECDLAARHLKALDDILHFLKRAVRQMAFLASCLTRARIIRGSRQRRVIANNCS